MSGIRETPAPEFPILSDKLALWDAMSGSGNFRVYHANATAELRRMFRLIDDMREALIECEEYFDNRADADCEGDPLEFVPNKEMRLLNAVQAALK